MKKIPKIFFHSFNYSSKYSTKTKISQIRKLFSKIVSGMSFIVYFYSSLISLLENPKTNCGTTKAQLTIIFVDSFELENIFWILGFSQL